MEVEADVRTEVPIGASPAPEQMAPENEAENVPLQPNIQWETVAGADSYTLHVSHGDEMVVEQEVDSTIFVPSERFSTSTTYYWRVGATVKGTSVKWSEIHSFTTTETAREPLPAPKQMAPENDAEDISVQPNIEWEAVTGASAYTLHVSRGDQMVVEQQVYDTSFTPDETFSTDGTYFWRVKAVGGGTQNWSPIRNFTTTKQGNTNTGGDATQDRQALMDLYSATGGDQWKNNSGWGQGAPSNSWHGIQVNSQGRVTRVDLFNNALSGPLPESMGDLEKVTHLNLKNNKLTGPIPQSIGNMESLESLILSGRTYDIGGTLKAPPENLNYAYHPGKRSSSTNRFTGTIPSSIGQLSNLEFLEISDQAGITGPLPSEIGTLSSLKGLYLNTLDLDGYRIPETFGNLTELRHFYVSGSDVIGQLPGGLKNMQKLTYINIVSSETLGKGLTGALPDFSNLTNLRSLVLSNNEFEGSYPSYFNNGNFTGLHTLRITWSNLTGSLHGFNNLPALESLGLEGNNLSGSVKQQLSQLPDRLQILGLGWNNFSGGLPQSGWANFEQLKTLYLNNNGLTGSIPCDFWNKIDNSKLGIAWVSNNNFSNNCTSAMNSVEGAGNPDIQAGGNNF
jgi:hypothetical protein